MAETVDMAAVPVRLAIVVVTHNSARHIGQCLDSLAMHAPGVPVVVVDNASTDATRGILADYCGRMPALHAIDLAENVGFGAANNIAMRFLPAEHYLLFNQDAWLLADSIGPALAAMARDPRIAVASIPQVYPDGSPQTYAFAFSSWGKWLLQALGLRTLAGWLLARPMLAALARRLPLAAEYVRIHARERVDTMRPPAGDNTVRDVDWVCGAAMLLEGGFVRETGGFDEAIFLYGEDEDLCKAAHARDRRVVVVDTVPVVHVLGWGEHRYNPVVARMKYRSLRYFIDKHHGGTLAGWMMRRLLPLHVFGWRRLFDARGGGMSAAAEPKGRWRALLAHLRVCADEAGEAALLRELADVDRPVVVAFANAHAFNLAWRDPTFAADLLAADVLLRDGIGMSLLMRACGLAPGRNLNGTDFIPALLGALPRARAVAVLGTEEPWLSGGKAWLEGEGFTDVCVAHGFHPEDWYEAQPGVLDADVALLAMGMPKQERVAMRLRARAGTRPLLILNGGAVVDFRAGRFPRAPLWVRRLRMEWAYRLLREPRRLWRRYVIGNLVFLWRALRVARRYDANGGEQP